MVVRTRSRVVPGSGRQLVIKTGSVQQSIWNKAQYRCVDHFHVDGDGYDVQIYTSVRNSEQGGWMHGSNGIYDLDHCVLTAYSNLGYGNNHVSITDRPSNGSLATRLLASTNPNRPVVDLPVFISELRDLPRLLKVEGDSVIKKIASGNLNYWFGWRPLISDLKKLVDFTHHYESRAREIKALQEGGLKRKQQLWSGSATSRSYLTAQSTTFLVKGWQQRVTTQKVWGFVEWNSNSLPRMTPAEMLSLARRAVLGLELSPHTAWEAIPWSWLVDWCSNAGDYLMQTRNIIPVTHTVPQIMEMTLTEEKFIPDVFPSWMDPDKLKFSGSFVTKKRTRASSTLNAQLPFLSGRQLSILASIGLLRR